MSVESLSVASTPTELPQPEAANPRTDRDNERMSAERKEVFMAKAPVW